MVTRTLAQLAELVGGELDGRVEIGQVAALFADAGTIVLTAFISPYRAGRARAREAVGEERFVEVFVDAPIKLCTERDPKGLYRKAHSGEITDFTGVDAPYETPTEPHLVLRTAEMTVDNCVDALVACLQERKLLSPPAADAK